MKMGIDVDCKCVNVLAIGNRPGGKLAHNAKQKGNTKLLQSNLPGTFMAAHSAAYEKCLLLGG